MVSAPKRPAWIWPLLRPRHTVHPVHKIQWLKYDMGRIPNITPHGNGLADWSEGDIDYYLSTGFTPDFDTVGGSTVTS